MTIRAWRIIKAKHAGTAFSGIGAKDYGGRWNNPGIAIVYTAGSISLAMLEMLVHLQPHDLIRHYVLFEVSFEDTLMKTITTEKLPRTWHKSPSSAKVRQVGDDWWAGGESAILQLPSAIVPSEWNYLLNPEHPDFEKITIGRKQPIKFDPRLIKTPTP